MGCGVGNYIGMFALAVGCGGVIETDCETFGRGIGIVVGDGGDTGAI